jgi:hypothetical protein
MVKPCHVIVKLGYKAIQQNKQYKVMLHTHDNTIESILETPAQFLEMTYSNTDYKNEYWGDVKGSSIHLFNHHEDGNRLYFNFNNPWIGYPSARLGFNEDVEWNNGHNFSQEESYTWILDNVHYKVTRFDDTDCKEFLLEIDVL